MPHLLCCQGLAVPTASVPGTMDFLSVCGKTYQVDVRGFLVNPDE